jgi:thioredoxin 1
MRNNLVSILLLSCLISISTVLSFSQEPKCKKVLLIFSASWCKFCHEAKQDMDMDPILSEMIKNYEIVEIDFDLDKDIVTGYNIKSIPTFILFDDGKEISRKTGYKHPKDLIKFLK